MKINLLNALPGDDPTCKRIPLTQGQSTLVSAEDFDRLNQHRWHARWDPHVDSFYAARTIRLENGKYTTQPMHREVLALQPGDPGQVDHENHNTLDNRRSNVRKTDHRGNGGNRRDQSEYGAGVKRVGDRFVARVWVNRRNRYAGTYDTPEEARQAREEFLRVLGLASHLGARPS